MRSSYCSRKAPYSPGPTASPQRTFKGWVEERGHSFMHSWDPHYQALTETHDAGQDAQKGGLLYARYGKGAYVYVAYALYRQLPEGIPGAYRLFANLLSLPKAPATHRRSHRPKIIPAINRPAGTLRHPD